MKVVFVLIATLLFVTAAQAQQAIAPGGSTLPSYIAGPTWFPTVFKPYQEGLIRKPTSCAQVPDKQRAVYRVRSYLRALIRVRSASASTSSRGRAVSAVLEVS